MAAPATQHRTADNKGKRWPTSGNEEKDDPQQAGDQRGPVEQEVPPGRV